MTVVLTKTTKLTKLQIHDMFVSIALHNKSLQEAFSLFAKFGHLVTIKGL
jgi:hypothetical protein